MKNKSNLFNKFIVLLLLVSLSSQNVVFAQEFQRQEKPRIGYADATGKVSFIGVDPSSQDDHSADTATITPTPTATETPLPEDAETPALPIIPEQSPENQNLIGPGNVESLSASIYYVNINTGNDMNTCTSVALPCQHIQETVNKASTGSVIYVTSGTYLFSTNGPPNVVIIDKSITLSGGWNTDFTSQTGASTINGANTNNGILVISGIVIVENFIIENARSANSGAIYVVNGNFTLEKSTLRNNVATSNGGGIYLDNGMLNIINSTISGNTAGSSGGGIYASNNSASVMIQNSTIAYNTASSGGGISQANGTYNLTNTIIANNTGTTSNPDCNGTISTVNYSIIENMTGCTITTGSNNLSVDPQIDSNLSGSMLVHMLLVGSPAINTGSASGCPPTDQRSFARPQGSGCDIGSIEYIGSGTKSIYILSGTNQESSINRAFVLNLVVLVLDQNDSPVSGVDVTFTAPAAGASGIFSASSTNTTIVTTGAGGVATASKFMANGTIGSYTVTASASGYSPVVFQLNNTPVSDPNGRYVSPTGSDTEPTTCNSPVAPCMTIDKAIQSAVAGDTIYVATGTYTSGGTEVVLIDKNVTLSGGWDAGFTAQIGYSTIDGGGIRRGVIILGSTVALDHFTIQNGYVYSGAGGGVASSSSTLTIANSIITNNVSKLGSGGGISNVNGILTLNDTLISNNQAGDGCCGGVSGGGGIYLHNSGTITLNRSAVINNRLFGGFMGSGIDAVGGTVILNNSTVSGNTGGDGTGIHLWAATGILNSSTISNNEKKGVIVASSTLNMQNTILALNGTSGDCYNDFGTVTSLGYNLVGNGNGCTITVTSGDKIGTSASPIDPRISLYPIEKGGFHLLLSGSPAINAANPATCPATDQRGVSRPQGAGCDIGSYEYGAVPGPAAFFGMISGSNQSGYVGNVFPEEMAVYVVDSLGNPVNGVEVTFSAPRTGAGVVFASASSKDLEKAQSDFARHSNGMFTSKLIYEITVVTVDGIATAPPFKANFQAGSYMVTASIPELVGSVSFSLTNLPISNQPNFLLNGGFEDPIQGNYWYADSLNFGTPFCTFAKCGNGGGTAGSRSGNTWVWFGGKPTYMEVGYISQSSIIIPAGPARLRFYLWIGYAEPGSTSNDKLTVTLGHHVDDIVIFTADATQKNLYPNYKLVEIDLSPYADGTSHYIKFEARTNGKVVNFNLDDISINAATFGDVPPDYWSWNWIERLYNVGITNGCTSAPLTYCPDNTVSRAQMAVFLLKGMHGSSYTPPAVGASTGFTDVATNYWAASWIKQLAAEGITGGCGNGNYCPDATVTRAQMAIFLLKAKHGSSYLPPNASGVFTDVPIGYWADKWIEQLNFEGFTSGCSYRFYCPDDSVTRAQMAVFLVKAFNLP